jgi:small subunit ribosomal protein S18
MGTQNSKKNIILTDIDYKNTSLLRRYISESGKISPRRVTGASAKEQRRVNKAVKIARYLALLPFCDNHKNQ